MILQYLKRVFYTNLWSYSKEETILNHAALDQGEWSAHTRVETMKKSDLMHIQYNS